MRISPNIATTKDDRPMQSAAEVTLLDYLPLIALVVTDAPNSVVGLSDASRVQSESVLPTMKEKLSVTLISFRLQYDSTNIVKVSF